MEQTRPSVSKDTYGKNGPMPSSVDTAASMELHVVWLQKYLQRTKQMTIGNCNTTRRRR